MFLISIFYVGGCKIGCLYRDDDDFVSQNLSPAYILTINWCSDWPSCSSSDMLTQKPFVGVCGININVRGCVLEEVRPVNVFSISRDTDFWLHLVVMMPAQQCRMTVLHIKLSRVSGLTFTVDELISPCLSWSHVLRFVPFKHVE